MPPITFVKRRFGDSYLIWLQKSNLYLQFEEPAWFVFSRLQKRYAAGTIAGECAVRYGMTRIESLRFVNDILSMVESINQPADFQWRNQKYPVEINDHPFIPYAVHYYLLGENPISFSFETRQLENYIHPLLEHLEIAARDSSTAFFELSGYDRKVIFRFNGQVKGVWANDESHLVKGLIFMHLINVLYNRTDDFWLMTVHASAVTNGQKTILFPAGQGCGKTTIAALLQDRGFKLVSDDFVPIDKYSFSAYHFPVAMSVKPGSAQIVSDIFPGIKNKPDHVISPDKTVRYISPGNSSGIFKSAYPVKEFVFIQYDKSVDLYWEKIEMLQGFKMLLDESWTSPDEGIAGTLFDRLPQWSFFKLTYSDNRKALDTLVDLFNEAG